MNSRIYRTLFATAAVLPPWSDAGVEEEEEDRSLSMRKESRGFQREEFCWIRNSQEDVVVVKCNRGLPCAAAYELNWKRLRRIAHS